MCVREQINNNRSRNNKNNKKNWQIQVQYSLLRTCVVAQTLITNNFTFYVVWDITHTHRERERERTRTYRIVRCIDVSWCIVSRTLDILLRNDEVTLWLDIVLFFAMVLRRLVIIELNLLLLRFSFLVVAFFFLPYFWRSFFLSFLFVCWRLIFSRCVVTTTKQTMRKFCRYSIGFSLPFLFCFWLTK